MRRPIRLYRPLQTFALFLVAALAFAVPPAIADDLGFFEQRRVLSDAEHALAAGNYDQAAELFGRVIEGTDADNGRHTQALLGAALAELGHHGGDLEAARGHLAAYLASGDAEQKPVAKAMQQLLDRATEAPKAAPSRPSKPEPAEQPVVAESRDESAERIAALEKQLAAARSEIAEKEKVIEELRKIVVDEGG